MECNRFQTESIIAWLTSYMSQSDATASNIGLFMNLLFSNNIDGIDNPVESLLDDLLNQLSTSNLMYSSKINTMAVKSMGAFILAISESLSPICIQVLSFYIPKLLDADAPTLRTFVIHSIVNLIKNASDEELKRSWFQLIVDRCHDSSSFTRNAAIKAISDLTQFNIPVSLYPLIAQVVNDRLSDKTMTVKKSCLELVTALISHNPFMCDLNLNLFEEKLLNPDNNEK